jgi:hypothetical protein
VLITGKLEKTEPVQKKKKGKKKKEEEKEKKEIKRSIKKKIPKKKKFLAFGGCGRRIAMNLLLA